MKSTVWKLFALSLMLVFTALITFIKHFLGQIARELEAMNKIKEPLKSELLNGKWELLYTTSQSVLQTQVSRLLHILFPHHPVSFLQWVRILLVRFLLLWQRPKSLRPNGKIYQAINADTLRAQNIETWPFFNQVIHLYSRLNISLYLHLLSALLLCCALSA